MTTPFDTTRLDEECDRIAREMRGDQLRKWSPIPSQIKALIVGNIPYMHSEYARDIYNRLRRPKMVPA